MDGRAAAEPRPGTGPRAGYNIWALPRGLSGGARIGSFTIRKAEGEAWFEIREAHGLTWLRALGLLAWGVGAFALARRCGYRPWVGWPVALAGLLAVQYLDVTTPWLRQHDVAGHREYIEHLHAHAELPGVLQGWETWQPPLYYCLAAAWQRIWPGGAYDDPFRPVQFLATALYLATVVAALPAFGRLGLSGIQAAAGLCALALVPAHLFFAGRINNDVLLPVLGAGVMLATAKCAAPEAVPDARGRRWLWALGVLLAAMLAAKSSSLGIACGALAAVFWAEGRRSGWGRAVWRTYLVGLPAAAWLVFWWARNYAQTGAPLYVNAGLPEGLRVLAPAWRRLLSFDLNAFIGGQYYYDAPMRQSAPTALVTSLLYGEYGMNELGFRWSAWLRWGCLGMLLVLAAGVPRAAAPRTARRTDGLPLAGRLPERARGRVHRSVPIRLQPECAVRCPGLRAVRRFVWLGRRPFLDWGWLGRAGRPDGHGGVVSARAGGALFARDVLNAHQSKQML